jgi:hypothetical protein
MCAGTWSVCLWAARTWMLMDPHASVCGIGHGWGSGNACCSWAFMILLSAMFCAGDQRAIFSSATWLFICVWWAIMHSYRNGRYERERHRSSHHQRIRARFLASEEGRHHVRWFLDVLKVPFKHRPTQYLVPKDFHLLCNQTKEPVSVTSTPNEWPNQAGMA